MSLVGSIVKGATTVATELGKVVKKAAKKVKNVASQVLDGLFGKEGLASKAYSKVKSLGTMALGKILPEYGDDVIQPLQAASSSTKAAGGTGFLNAMSQTLETAVTESGKAITGITDWFKEGFTYVGGKIKDGASYVYDSTLEFFGMKEPQKVENPGKWVADKSREKFEAAQAAGKADPWVVSDEIYDMNSKRGVSELIGTPTYPLSTENQPLNLQYEAAKTAGMDAGMLEAARDLGVTPTDPRLSKIQSDGMVASGVNIPNSETQSYEDMIRTGAAGPMTESNSLLDKAMEYAPLVAEGLLAGMATGSGGAVPAGGGSAPQGVGTGNRSGIGGKGSAGGDFLSEAQRAFLEKQRRVIEQMG